ncbi:hypothetical protein [Rhodococcoides yunnanense]|uniref:hypothetical protein n=1 Tax=Rhodococcoides yunnanense TaxID=278209 RepID=UPI000934EF3D|nr:hypothetical protein [Rhodococcus yunnanensis]
MLNVDPDMLRGIARRYRNAASEMAAIDGRGVAALLDGALPGSSTAVVASAIGGMATTAYDSAAGRLHSLAAAANACADEYDRTEQSNAALLAVLGFE